MNDDLAQIEFYFPNGKFDNKEELAHSIINTMKEKGSIGYSGYADIDLLKQGLLDHIGTGDINRYKPLSEKQKKEIETVIVETIKKCNKKLSVPTKNFVFVHPYLPSQGEKIFEGVMAVAVYSCVFHVFIDPEQYTKRSLENTVAHELNHTVYYYHHYDDFNNYTLLDEILLEGLAENFKEQCFDSEIAPWVGALSKEEAFGVLKDSGDILNSRDQTIIKGFLFGNDRYKKWTGYSVGYWLVKEFIKGGSDLSWDELLKMESHEFLKMPKIKRKEGVQ